MNTLRIGETRININQAYTLAMIEEVTLQTLAKRPCFILSIPSSADVNRHDILVSPSVPVTFTYGQGEFPPEDFDRDEFYKAVDVVVEKVADIGFLPLSALLGEDATITRD